MTTYLGKGYSFGLPRVPFVNCRHFMYLVISLLALRAGCGIWLYQFLNIAYLFTLNRLPIWNSQNCSMFPLAFVAGWLQGHWWGFISRNYVVDPSSFLWMFSLLLKDLISDFYVLSHALLYTYRSLCLFFQSYLAMWSLTLGKRELVSVLLVYLFGNFSSRQFLSFFFPSLCQELAATCDCGTFWTFLLSFYEVRSWLF